MEKKRKKATRKKMLSDQYNRLVKSINALEIAFLRVKSPRAAMAMSKAIDGLWEVLNSIREKIKK
jgi:ABC-type transport system involved in cytochrome bd biosynthesis fused ATPase/permease subunit